MESNEVRIFLALARERSVRGAGGVLGVSHSTVARKIDALERRLGCKLFDRSRDGFSLTAAGERMRPRAERIEATFARQAALFRGDEATRWTPRAGAAARPSGAPAGPSGAPDKPPVAPAD